MSQNLSLYEDALQFYLIISIDTGELSENMQFAREVRGLYSVHGGVFSPRAIYCWMKLVLIKFNEWK